MDCEQRFCPNQSCTVDFWMVRRAVDEHELWHLNDRFGGGVFMVAAVDPVCPRCGTTLCLTAAPAQRLGGDVLEAAPVLELAGNLS